VLKESKFKEHGQITPGPSRSPLENALIHSSENLEEFVAAGDFLVYKFPVWTW